MYIGLNGADCCRGSVQNLYCAGRHKQSHTEVEESVITPFIGWLSQTWSVPCSEISAHTHFTHTLVHTWHFQSRISINHSAFSRLLKVFVTFFYPLRLFLLLHTLSVSSSVSFISVQFSRGPRAKGQQHPQTVVTSYFQLSVVLWLRCDACWASCFVLKHKKLIQTLTYRMSYNTKFWSKSWLMIWKPLFSLSTIQKWIYRFSHAGDYFWKTKCWFSVN